MYEPMHTARVRRDSWFVRLFLFMWPIRPERIDFCKLFWGYVFALPNLVVRLVTAPIYYPGRALVRKAERARYEREEEYMNLPAEVRNHLDMERRNRALEKARKWEARFEAIGSFFDRFLVAPIKWLVAARATKWALKGLVVLIGLAIVAGTAFGLYWLGDLIVNNADLAILVIGIAAGLIAAGIVALYGGFAVADGPAGAVIKEKTHSFGSAMKTGFWGVKNRTCPRIELTQD